MIVKISYYHSTKLYRVLFQTRMVLHHRHRLNVFHRTETTSHITSRKHRASHTYIFFLPSADTIFEWMSHIGKKMWREENEEDTWRSLLFCSFAFVGWGSDIVIAIDQRERIERRRRRSFAVSFRCQNHYKFRKEMGTADLDSAPTLHSPLCSQRQLF